MPVHHVPKGHSAVSPFLGVKNARGLADFIVNTFGAELQICGAGPDGTIHHAEAKIGDSVIMLGEACAEFGVMTAAVHVYVPNADETYAKALKAGGTVVRAVETHFYGDRSGGVRDAFGNTWWISTHVEDVTPEEMERRMKAHVQQAKK